MPYRDEDRVGNVKFLWEVSRHQHLTAGVEYAAIPLTPKPLGVRRFHCGDSQAAQHVGGVIDDPALPTYDPDYYQGCNPLACCPPNQYGEGVCPFRRMFESSSFPVDQYGNMSLVDAHGGASAGTWGQLEGLFAIRDTGEPGETTTSVFFVFGWTRPGRYGRSGDPIQDYPPGTDVSFEFRHRYGPSVPSFLLAYPHVRVVHYGTADVSWASPGYVDASDLTEIAHNLTKAACFGLASEGGLPDCGDWWADTNADGRINAGDLSCWAWENAHVQNCQISKAGQRESTAHILAWFGMRYSGKDVMSGGIEMPEVVVADEAQLQRAMLDPYGYRNTSFGSPASWSNSKTLYR